MENKPTKINTNGSNSKSPSPNPAPTKKEESQESPANRETEAPTTEAKVSEAAQSSKTVVMKTETAEIISTLPGSRSSPVHTTTASSSSSAAPTPDPEPMPALNPGANGDMDTTTSYEIKWNNYASVLQNVFRKVLISHQFSDVTLACEGESIKCHRILLAACSSYFEKLLNDNQDSKLVIYMKDMKMWELKALVNFMYNGQVSVQETQLPNFMKAAEALNISGLDAPSSGQATSNGLAEARTVSESASTVPAKIISTFKRPSLSIENTRIQSGSGVPKAGTNTITQVRPVPALQAQPNFRAQDTMKRKILLNNMHGGPPKLVKMQQVRSNGVNNLGMRSTAWRGVAGVVKPKESVGQNGSNTSTQQLGQVVGYENEDYQDDDELDQPSLGDDDSQGLRGLDEGQSPSTAQLENGDDDDELEDGTDLQQYENDDEDSYMDGQLMNVYGLEGNQDDEQFDDDDEPPYDEDGEDGAMVINETPLIRTRNGRTYSPELQEAAFDALRNGVSIRQCSELYGIPRKTLGKWKNRGLHLQSSAVKNVQHISLSSAVPKKRGPAVGTTLTGPEGVDRARRLQKATKLAMSGITVRQAAAHFDIPRTTLCAYMKRQGLASQARNVNNAKAQNFFQQQQIQQGRVGATTITLSRNNGTGGGNYKLVTNSTGVRGQQQGAEQDMENDELEEEEEIPFLGLSDFIDQNSDNWEAVN